MTLNMEHAPPEKRRRRPPLACIACRRRKVRCDRKLPCQNCVRARRAASCSYVSDERVEPREGTEGFEDGINGRHPQRDALSSVPFFTAASACTPNDSPEQLAERVKQLEQRLGQVINAQNGRGPAHPGLPNPCLNNASSHPPKSLGPEHWQVIGSGAAGNGVPRARLSREARRPNREGDAEGPNTEDDCSMAGNVNAILAKSRYLGNSHWIHGVTLVSPTFFYSRPNPRRTKEALPVCSWQTTLLLACVLRLVMQHILNSRLPSSRDTQ